MTDSSDFEPLTEVRIAQVYTRPICLFIRRINYCLLRGKKGGKDHQKQPLDGQSWWFVPPPVLHSLRKGGAMADLVAVQVALGPQASLPKFPLLSRDQGP